MACTYTFKCPACETIVEAEYSMKDFQDQHPPCSSCGDLCNYHWVPSVPQIVLKDGATGSWPSKGNRFKQYRQKASEAATKRQQNRYGDPKGAVPNYDGKETESWREAKSIAIKEQGLKVAPSYDQKITQESSGKIVT